MPGIIPPMPHGIQAVLNPAPNQDSVSRLVSRLAHWLWFGGAPGGGLNAVPGQAAQMFNPTSRNGLLNIASMLAGRGGDMPPEFQGWTEPYSLPKAVASGQVAFREGQPWSFRSDINTIKTNNLLKRAGQGIKQNNYDLYNAAHMQALHDALFGGETWMAPGMNIPRRPGG